MIARTRYFVVASLLVLVVGLGTALIAYYQGFPVGAFMQRRGPAELRYIPSSAAVLAYADVRDVMNSELRRKVHEAVPVPENGQREFENETGINIETDIDRIVGCLDPGRDGGKGAGMVIARGRFNEAKIEALMRDHGATVESYQGTRIIVGSAPVSDHTEHFAVAFIESGLVAVGSDSMVRAAIDLRKGGQNITSNDDLMNLVRSLESGNAWAVGRFDVLSAKAHLPDAVASQLPAITWFSVSSHIDGGIRGVIRAETRDEPSATNLRDVVRGFMALAKMQVSSKPELQATLQALELGGTGKTVELSFAVPAEIFDKLGHLKDGTAPTRPRGGR